MNDKEDRREKTCSGTIGKTLRAAGNIMHDSVNELLRARKTGEERQETVAREVRSRRAGKKQSGKARWNSLEKCQVTSGNCEDF